MLEESPKPEVQSPPSNGVIVPKQAKWHGRLAARLIYFVASILGATIRFTWRDESGLFNDGYTQPVIFCLWHNRLALCLNLYRAYVLRRHPARKLAAMVSASRDGGMLARALELFGVQPVRGSTSRRGPQALREMTTWAEQGHDLAITPDGPRGPCYVVQDGIVALAQVTGRPIVPVSYHLNWKLRAGRWDHFQVPLPFAKCEVRLGPPLRVPRESSDEEREALRTELENRMRAITRD
jgi:hypothetical protein